MPNRIYFGDNLPILQAMSTGSVDLIYIDPPFNTGKVQGRTQVKTTRNAEGDRTGFGGRRYETVRLDSRSYIDLFDDYLAFLEPRLAEAHRVLTAHGSLYFHIDYREVHYCKMLLDTIFGRDCFLNEIIWAYDYGGRPKNRWPPKHDNILLYVKDQASYTFNYDDIERIPYMAPGLVGPEKAARGSCRPTRGGTRSSRPTARRRPVIRRKNRWASCAASCRRRRGPAISSWTSSPAAARPARPVLSLGRRFVLVDDNPQAIEVMRRRFAGVADIEWIGCKNLPGF